MSKVTTVQWFCDKCGKELMGRPGRVYVTRDTGNDECSGRVIIDYISAKAKSARPEKFEGEVADSMLCAKCKKSILDDLLRRLKEEIKHGR